MTLLTTTQAAEQLGISPAGVRKLVQYGKLPARRFPAGNALAFASSDIERAKSRPKAGRPRLTVPSAR